MSFLALYNPQNVDVKKGLEKIQVSFSRQTRKYLRKK